MFGWFLNTPLALLMQHKYIISINPKRYEKIIRKVIMELWKNDIRHTFISFHGSYMESPTHPPQEDGGIILSALNIYLTLGGLRFF